MRRQRHRYPLRLGLHLFPLLAGFFIYTVPISAQTPAPPAPYVLPNGLRVVMRERHSSPLVAIDLWVRAGARYETENEIGSAHFLEHTLFKGTRTRGPGETDIAIENLGATLNAATGPDAAHFYTTVASVHLSEALQIIADVVQNATLPTPEIERERGVILDELAQHNADVAAQLIDRLYALAFTQHPYRRSPGGAPETIGARTRATLSAFYQRTYTPERCTLALAGDLTPERAQEAAQQAFGKWNRTDQQVQKTPSSEPQHSAPRTAQFSIETGQSQIGIAFPAPPASESVMSCAALVVAALLGESDGDGRLGSAHNPGMEASTRYTPRLETSLFLLTSALPTNSRVQTDAADVAIRLTELETRLLSAVRGLQANPPTAAEIAAAKGQVAGRAQFEQETNIGLARAIAYADIIGGDTPEIFLTRLRQLKPQDIQDFLRRYLLPDQRVSVRLLPAQNTAN